MNEAGRQAVARLAREVLAVRPLAEKLCGNSDPVGLMLADETVPGTRELLGWVLARVGGMTPSPGGLTDDVSVEAYLRVVRERVAPALADAVSRTTAGSLEVVVDEVVRDDLLTLLERRTVTGSDGVRFPAYAAGPPGAPAVVISSACGMPVRLAERWIRRLAVGHRVLIGESRGLFGGGPQDPDPSGTGDDVAAQASDLVAVMDQFGVRQAHIAGLCGGAVLAVEAAARHPERVLGLSLWHGDFDLGPDTVKTDHQRNLQALLGMAAGSRTAAARIHPIVGQAILDAAPPGLAHLVLYPYATVELMYRYCRLNGAIMNWDVSGALARVDVPTAVITSEDDRTAHPDGSRMVAERLAGARLLVHREGDHLSLFQAAPAYLDEAAALIDGLRATV